LLFYRVRDKERYRLRRQYRKNDLDSFRKMQQLRKEFLQAKSIFQLMLEREKLGEVSYKYRIVYSFLLLTISALFL